MQTCSLCNAISPDTSLLCANCKADLTTKSASVVALAKFQMNQRVTSVRVNAAHDACPVCGDARGTFSKEEVARLPHVGCSHPQGCRCTYEPVLGDLYP